VWMRRRDTTELGLFFGVSDCRLDLAPRC